MSTEYTLGYDPDESHEADLYQSYDPAKSRTRYRGFSVGPPPVGKTMPLPSDEHRSRWHWLKEYQAPVGRTYSAEFCTEDPPCEVIGRIGPRLVNSAVITDVRPYEPA